LLRPPGARLDRRLAGEPKRSRGWARRLVGLVGPSVSFLCSDSCSFAALGGEEFWGSCVCVAPAQVAWRRRVITTWLGWFELFNTNSRRGPKWASMGLAQEL
jgi:hypothetical protein